MAEQNPDQGPNLRLTRPFAAPLTCPVKPGRAGKARAQGRKTAPSSLLGEHRAGSKGLALGREKMGILSSEAGIEAVEAPLAPLGATLWVKLAQRWLERT